MKKAIEEIISYETELEHKLDILTSLGITARSREIFEACEEIRSELCCDGDDALPDRKGRKDDSLEGGHAPKEIRNVLQQSGRNEAHEPDSVRARLDALLSTLNAKKQKTFEFHGMVLPTAKVKAFLKECKNLSDLEVSSDEGGLNFTWSNGVASFCSMEEK